MDDIYFSDKKRPDRKSADGGDKYLKADYFDESFSLEFRKGMGNAQSFQEPPLPDEELFTSFAQEAYSDAPAQDSYVEDIDVLFGTPEKYQDGEREMQNSNQHNDRTVRSPKNGNAAGGRTVRPVSNNSLAGDPSRVPTGRRVVPQSADLHSGERTPKNNKKKKSRKLNIIIAVLAVVIVAVGAVVAYAYSRVDSMLNSLNYDDTIIKDRYLSPDAPVSDEVKNILLIGSDARAEVSGQRSDTMILFTIDSANSQIKLTSFLRDSYVYIPCIERKGKMNAAYSNGGAQGVIDTVEYNYGIDVHNYVSVDFETFEKIVDLIGGVTIDGVTQKEARYMNSEADTDIKEGSNHMNGYEALWYCRIRKIDSDFYRTKRQRKVLTAVIDKAKEIKPNELMKLIEQVLPNVSTDLSKNEIKDLGTKAVSYIGYETVQMQVPADGTWRDGNVGGSYVIDFDLEKNKDMLKAFVYEKVEQAEE